MSTMRRRFWKKEEAPEYIEGATYTDHEVELMADALLRADGKREKCRICGEIGEQTGEARTEPQFERDEETNEILGPLVDSEGRQLRVIFHTLACCNGHEWSEGEGKAKVTTRSSSKSISLPVRGVRSTRRTVHLIPVLSVEVTIRRILRDAESTLRIVAKNTELVSTHERRRVLRS